MDELAHSSDDGGGMGRRGGRKRNRSRPEAVARNRCACRELQCLTCSPAKKGRCRGVGSALLSEPEPSSGVEASAGLAAARKSELSSVTDPCPGLEFWRAPQPRLVTRGRTRVAGLSKRSAEAEAGGEGTGAGGACCARGGQGGAGRGVRDVAAGANACQERAASDRQNCCPSRVDLDGKEGPTRSPRVPEEGHDTAEERIALWLQVIAGPVRLVLALSAGVSV